MHPGPCEGCGGGNAVSWRRGEREREREREGGGGGVAGRPAPGD